MSEEIKNLIIETQIELEKIGEELLKTVSRRSIDHSDLYGFFIKDVFVDLTNITRQYLQLIKTDEQNLKSVEEIKKRLLRCLVKAWEKLVAAKSENVERSIKFILFSRFKGDYKEKIGSISQLDKEVNNPNLNLTLEERIEKLKEIVELYNELHTTAWFKNALLVFSIIGLVIAVGAIIVSIFLYLASKNNASPEVSGITVKNSIIFLVPFKKFTNK